MVLVYCDCLCCSVSLACSVMCRSLRSLIVAFPGYTHLQFNTHCINEQLSGEGSDEFAHISRHRQSTDTDELSGQNEVL